MGTLMVMVMVVSSTAGFGPLDLCQPVPWPPAEAAVEDVIARIGESAGCPYAVAPSGRVLMSHRAPRLTAQSTTVRSSLDILESLVGVEVWIGPGMMVWFAGGLRPSLLGAATRARTAPSCGWEPARWRRTGTLELTDCAVAEALQGVSSAFDVPIAYLEEYLPGSKRITLHAEGIELAQALAIVCDTLGLRRASSCGDALVVKVTGPRRGSVRERETPGNVSVIDGWRRAADQRAAERLCRQAKGVEARRRSLP